MDQKYRDNGARTADRALTNWREEDEDGRDELSRRRDQNPQQQRPSLTPRERQERWPLG